MPTTSEYTSRPGPDGRSGEDHHPRHRGGIGFALFLVLAGLVLLAERLGWLSNGFDWLFPVVLIAWGFSELYERLSAR